MPRLKRRGILRLPRARSAVFMGSAILTILGSGNLFKIGLLGGHVPYGVTAHGSPSGALQLDRLGRYPCR